MFEPVSSKVSFPDVERGVLAFWKRHDTFRKSLDLRRGAPEFVFYDGPPFATGLPHYGHLLAGTIKDIVPRYQTMRGRFVERRFGWDCHGLPIEALAQEALGISGAHEIRAYGVDKFNEQCRSMVLRYVGEWRETVARMGRWVDFDNDYKTMDRAFMETIWWVFKRLWDQGRVYKSYRIMPYSWKLNTPLSNFEAGSNYKDVQDPAVTCRLRVTEGAPAAWGATYLLIWTTTPWTLPGNLGVCAGPEIEYTVVRDRKEQVCYVLATARLDAYYKKAEDCEVVARLSGRDLPGWRYEPLFPHFAGSPGAFRVFNDSFVTTADGTGLVHLAPAYGEDDFRVCRAASVPLVDPLDESCCFTAAVPEYAGRFCKDCDKDIIQRLKHEGRLVHQTTIVHSYPFCERTDTPLVFRAIEAWYVRVEDLRDRLAALNEAVHWVPGYVGDKRFGNWLREAKDWNVSRNRFWGSCIPVWINENDPADMLCVGSIAELESLSGCKVEDLHKHHMDRIAIVRDGRTYRRTPEVLDCWFESGAMPYAQQHYPFERADRLQDFFPAAFIAEGLDQTRGWFYTLLVLGTLLFDKAPFRNVVVNGMVLAEDGRKMSKRLKNYPDPVYMLDTYGADALRLYLIHSPVVRAEDLRFSEDGVKEVLRHLLIPFWNAYSFFVTYANVDGWTPPGAAAGRSPNVLDRWILSSLESLAAGVTEAMDAYELQQAVRPFVRFMEDLTNWYIRRSRRRFWKSQDDADKAHAYATLYRVLQEFSKIAAPFLPFLAEAVHRNLRTADLPESVHLCDFPAADGALRDPALEESMDRVMTCVRLGRNLRAEHDLKVRQPLPALRVVTRNAALRHELAALQDIIADELNVKAVHFGEHETELATLRAKPDFKVLGPRLGPRVKEAAKALAALPSEALAPLTEGGAVRVTVGGEAVELRAGDVVLERAPKAHLVVAAEGEIVVALETELTPELLREGLARELVNKIQNMRKDAGLEVTQRIAVTLAADDEVRAAVEAFGDYVRAETLSVSCVFGDPAGQGAEWDLNGRPCRVRIEPQRGA